ncbi:hypothetical protein [Microbacterium sp. T32]|uniref:hypothetical protein n=1 Tax=Microbacterium sp. T32 TaxID=1776083 RepID=UPI0007AB644C|nr:hypothetical protein [Microbacterium sp. T32]KZE41376.1 hypothetical protein AVW09_01970 [Microbacterium sp. T32]
MGVGCGGCLVVLGGGLLLIIAAVVIGAFAGFTPSANKYTAAQQCEQTVSSYLKAPSTAQFHSDISAATESAIDAGPWLIIGTVDSENGFGAMLRSNYSCHVTFTPSSNSYAVELQGVG